MKELVLILKGLKKTGAPFGGVTHEELGAILFKLVRVLAPEELDKAIKKLNIED